MCVCVCVCVYVCVWVCASVYWTLSSRAGSYPTVGLDSEFFYIPWSTKAK